jgi:hypothetical protein
MAGTTGPQTMPVELNARVSAIGHHMNAVTDTENLAVFHTDINTLMPNHFYQISVIAAGLVQAVPEEDTVIIPSSSNEPSGYVLAITVQMIPAR